MKNGRDGLLGKTKIPFSCRLRSCFVCKNILSKSKQSYLKLKKIENPLIFFGLLV